RTPEQGLFSTQICHLIAPCRWEVYSMLLREAIQSYHDLLSDDLAAASHAQLEDQLRLRGLFFGQRALATVLRPRFITNEQYRFLQTRVQAVLRAFERAYHTALEDRGLRA